MVKQYKNGNLGISAYSRMCWGRFSRCLQVFKDAGLAAFLDAVLDGYHATIFAYGRSGWQGCRVFWGFLGRHLKNFDISFWDMLFG